MGWAQVAVMAAGTAAQIYGQQKSRKAQVKSMEAEAAFLEEQAAYTQDIGLKKEKAALREAHQLFGDQVNSFSRNNATLSGSALDELVDTQQAYAQEIEALRNDVAFDVNVARSKAAAQREGARGLKKMGFLQDITTGLIGGAQVGSAINQNVSRSTTTDNKKTLLTSNGGSSSYGSSSSLNRNTRPRADY